MWITCYHLSQIGRYVKQEINDLFISYTNLTYTDSDNMEWLRFFVISAIVTTLCMSLGPVLYQHYYYGNDSDTIIHVKKFRPNPRMRIVCGNVDSIKCDICTVFVNGLRTLVGRQASEKDIVNFSIEVCEFFKIEDHRVCQGIVRMFKVCILVRNDTNVNGHERLSNITPRQKLK